MLRIVDEVQPLAVDDQHRAVGVIVEVARVGFRQAAQVVVVDAGLDGVAAFLHAMHQRIDGSLQVDHQVRHRRLRLHVQEDLVVELVLGVVEREAGEQRVLCEREVGDDGLLEQVGLLQRLELRHPLEQEEELRRQRMAAHVTVKKRQERIGRRILEEGSGIEALRQALGEARLAAADRAFDNDVAMLHGTSPLARPRPGMTASGQTSSKGRSTKARSCARGCGTCSPGSSITRSP